jgi:hypothetical protein
VGDSFPGWCGERKIRIAEYWHIEESPATLYQLKDGSTTEDKPKNESRIVQQREIRKQRVVMSVINAVEVIEPKDATEDGDWGQPWPGSKIPQIRFCGEDLDVDGERYLAGIVRDAKHPQQMYNYWASAATETIALAPRAPFVGAVGQFEGQEQKWAMANVRNLAYLEYNTVDVAGRPAPPPQRQAVEPPIQAMAQMLRQADYDLQSTTGRFDPSLGKQTSQAESGKAITALQRQGDVATYNFGDNATRSIEARGQMLVDLIPHYYDAPRVQRILKPDGTSSHVVVHNSASSGMSNAEAQFSLGDEGAGIERVYDLGVGRYNVVVTTGPSHQTRRQEAVASIMALVQAFPQIIPVAGDLLVGDMDWPQAKEIAARMKRMLPPQLQDQDDQDPAAAANRLQGQVQQMGQLIDRLTAELNNKNQVIESKTVENQTKLEITRMQEETKLITAQLQAKVQSAVGLADNQLKTLEMFHDSAHEQAMAVHGHVMGGGEPQPPGQPTPPGPPPPPSPPPPEGAGANA